MIQNKTSGIELNQHQVQILGFANILNTAGESVGNTIEMSAKKIGLEIKNEKIKILKLFNCEISNTPRVFEKKNQHISMYKRSR